MPTTQLDYAKHIFTSIDREWFPEPTWDDAPVVPKEDQVAPNIKALIQGLAAGWASDGPSPSGIGYQDQVDYTVQQSRIATAKGFWLDYVAADFFGDRLTRHFNETDFNFRKRILINLLAERGTRCALICNLTNLTGFKPVIIEPMNTGDTGAYIGMTSVVKTAIRQTEAYNGLVINGPSGIIFDQKFNQWSLYDDHTLTDGYTLVVNGAIDHSSENDLNILLYWHHNVYLHSESSDRWFIGNTNPTPGNNYTFYPQGDPRHFSTGTSDQDIVQQIVEPVYSYSDTPQVAGLAWADNDGNGGAGYYSSMDMPFQLFIQAYRPLGQGIPNVGGFDSPLWGWADTGPVGGYVGGRIPENFGIGSWVADDEVTGSVTDQDIYDTIANTLPAGVVGWTSISDFVSVDHEFSTGFLDLNFYLDGSCLASEFISPDSLTATITPFRISTSGKLFQPTFAASNVIPVRITTTGSAINNPQKAIAVITLPIIMSAAFNINPLLMRASLPIKLISTGITNNNVKATISLPITVTNQIGTVNSATAISTVVKIGMKMTAVSQPRGITVINITSTTNTFGQFIPGGLLGVSFVLGKSKIGVNYGF